MILVSSERLIGALCSSGKFLISGSCRKRLKILGATSCGRVKFELVKIWVNIG